MPVGRNEQNFWKQRASSCPTFSCTWNKGGRRSPESAVAMHSMKPGWVAGQLGEGDRVLNLPGSAFPILYKKLLSRETKQKSR